MTGTPSSVVVVDLSCSALVVASPRGSAVLDPAVAAASVLATVYGADLPPGGDRVECSARSDALATIRPADRLTDPYAWVHRDRVEVSGLSVPVGELLAAPLQRALGHAAAATGDRVIVVVPSCWGRIRVGRVAAAVGRLGFPARMLRSALVTAEALPSSTARWAVVVESAADATTVTLVERAAGEVGIAGRALVHRVDPGVDGAVDDEVDRVLRQVVRLREETPCAMVGSFEILVRGRLVEQVVDACDRRRVLSFAVPPTAAAEALVRMLSIG